MAHVTASKQSSDGSPLTEKDARGGEPALSPAPDHRGSHVFAADDTALAVLDLVQEEQVHHPMHWPAWQRWGITFLYCSLQVFVTLTSTTFVSAEYDIGITFPASTQVITLGQSMFVLGTAIGPAFLGPLADMGGRKWVYVASILLYAILNIVGICSSCLRVQADKLRAPRLPTIFPCSSSSCS
jgi:hypothetical protein